MILYQIELIINILCSEMTEYVHLESIKRKKKLIISNTLVQSFLSFTVEMRCTL